MLWLSALRFLLNPSSDEVLRQPGRGASPSIGAGLGLLSGLTGVGGGIFLTPLLLLLRWAKTKTAAAVSALFILVNSAAGLLGNFTATRHVPAVGLVLAVAVIVGGSAGSYLGSRRFQPVVIKRLLAIVLLVAGAKLVLAS